MAAVADDVVPDGGDDLVADGFDAVVEAAKFLGLSRAYVYQLMDSGELRYAKFGRARRIPRRELLAYARRCMVAAEVKGPSR
jgi:excisionase family DNA binding protein